MVVQGKSRRWAVIVLACVLVALFVREAYAQHIPTPEICKSVGPGDWEYWANGCWQFPSSQPAFRGFVIR